MRRAPLSSLWCLPVGYNANCMFPWYLMPATRSALWPFCHLFLVIHFFFVSRSVCVLHWSKPSIITVGLHTLFYLGYFVTRCFTSHLESKHTTYLGEICLRQLVKKYSFFFEIVIYFVWKLLVWDIPWCHEMLMTWMDRRNNIFVVLPCSFHLTIGI